MDLMKEYLEQKKHSDTLVANLTAQLEIATLQNKYLDDKIVLLNQVVDLKKQIKENDPHFFDAFCRSRVRVVLELPDSVVGTEATPTRMYDCYKTFRGAKNTLTAKEFEELVEKAFGKPERPLYQTTERLKGVYVFYSKARVDEFDKRILEALETQV